jgi:hypothetical protein
MPNDSGEWPTKALVGTRTSGEHATTAILGALPAGEWTVFDRVRVGRRRTPLQVAVGPQGVFVVESRPRPRLPARDEIRPGGVRQDVVVEASRAAGAVAALTGLVEARHVTPVVCFVGRELAPVVAGDVVICSSRNLLAILTSGDEVLDPERRRLVALDLDASIGRTPRPARVRSRRRWLRAPLMGVLLACAGSLGLWQVAAVAAGADGPTDALTVVVR